MSRRIRLALSALAAALLMLAIAAAPGQAYRVGGAGWPDRTITYRIQAHGYAGAVDRAARLINRADVGVHLRRATSDDDLDVVVAYGGIACAGEARVGFQRWRTDYVTLGRGCSKSLITLTAVHEFGHVLGLDHETHVCARMNPSFDNSGTPSHCREHSLRYWLAHPLTRDDLRGLDAIYGY